MTDISVIILTGKEELHIGRCLEKLAALEPKQIFVVESQKGDRTHEIAEAMGALSASLLCWRTKLYHVESPLLSVRLNSRRPTCFRIWINGSK